MRPRGWVVGLLFGVLSMFRSVTVAARQRNHSKHSEHTSTAEVSTEAAGAMTSTRMGRAIGRMHLNMLRWYCVELAVAHESTVPCENYARMSRLVAATSTAERKSIARQIAAVAPKTTAEREDRARLVKAAYTAMQIAYCNVPAHKLACVNPDLQKEYDNLIKAAVAPAEALDRKAYHALTLNRKKTADDPPGQARSPSSTGKSNDDYLDNRHSYAYTPPSSWT